MAEIELVQERYLSGKGSLRIPPSEKPLRYGILYVDVIRPPTNKFLNLGWNPGRSRFGTLVFLRAGYVIDQRPIEFPKQSYDILGDPAGQALIAIKCMYEGILISFENLANFLGADWTTYTDLIKDYTNMDLLWDEIKFVAYADTAVQIRLYKLEYDSCSPDKDKKKKPPKPPAPRPPVPPGEGIPDLDTPYEPDADFPQDNQSPDQPADIDDVQEPPIGACTICAVTYLVTYEEDPDREFTIRLYAEIGNTSFTNVPSGSASWNGSIFIEAQGNASENQGCDNFRPIFVNGYSGAGTASKYTSVTIVSIIPE